MAEKTRAELIAELKGQAAPDLSTNRPPGEQPTTDPFAPLREPIGEEQRWQYAIVNVGMFQNAGRMAQALATAGGHGWELVTVYDKASNWMGGMEKGFLLLKRAVPPGARPHSWCITIRG